MFLKVPLVIPLMIYVNAPRFVDPFDFGFMLGTLVGPDLLDEAAHAPHFTIAEAALVMPTVASRDAGAQRVVGHAVILLAVSDY